MSLPVRRFLTVAASTLALTAAVAAPTPASAASMFFSKSSGTTASVTWLEMGELPSGPAAGNAHFGFLQVEDLGKGRARAFGEVVDVQCEQGVEPYQPGWHHGPALEQEDPGGCVVVDVRFIDGARSLSFSIDRKLTQATLTGTLDVSGHGPGPVGSPPVSITWSATGASYSSSESGRYSDEYGSYSYRYSFTGRDAVLGQGSRIGPMVFDDEAGESSQAQLGSYRSFDRGRG
jgi:hypothetical protein